jgi:hypothetical protein
MDGMHAEASTIDYQEGFSLNKPTDKMLMIFHILLYSST